MDLEQEWRFSQLEKRVEEADENAQAQAVLAAKAQERVEELEKLLRSYQAGGLGPFAKKAADALADEVAACVVRRELDSRSPAGDALLDYRNPPTTPRSDRLAALETRFESMGQQLRMTEARVHTSSVRLGALGVALLDLLDDLEEGRSPRISQEQARKVLDDQLGETPNLPAFHGLHRAWAFVVGTPGYDKQIWKAAEQQVLQKELGPRPIVPIAYPFQFFEKVSMPSAPAFLDPDPGDLSDPVLVDAMEKYIAEEKARTVEGIFRRADIDAAIAAGPMVMAQTEGLEKLGRILEANPPTKEPESIGSGFLVALVDGKVAGAIVGISPGEALRKKKVDDAIATARPDQIVCQPDSPWDRKGGKVIHPLAVEIDSFNDDFARYKCPLCGHVWAEELPQ